MVQTAGWAYTSVQITPLQDFGPGTGVGIYSEFHGTSTITFTVHIPDTHSEDYFQVPTTTFACNCGELSRVE